MIQLFPRFCRIRTTFGIDTGIDKGLFAHARGAFEGASDRMRGASNATKTPLNV